MAVPMGTPAPMMPPPPDHESESLMSQEAPAPVAAEGMKIDSVTMRPAKNGGFIVTCAKSPQTPSKDGPNYESNDYAFSALDEAMTFVRSEFGGGEAPAAEVGPEVGVGPL